MKQFYDVEFAGELISLPDEDKVGETVEEIRQPWTITRHDVEADTPTGAVTTVIRDAWHPLAELWLSDAGEFFQIRNREYPRLETNGKPVDSFAEAVSPDRLLRLNGQLSLFGDGRV